MRKPSLICLFATTILATCVLKNGPSLKSGFFSDSKSGKSRTLFFSEAEDGATPRGDSCGLNLTRRSFLGQNGGGKDPTVAAEANSNENFATIKTVMVRKSFWRKEKKISPLESRKKRIMSINHSGLKYVRPRPFISSEKLGMFTGYKRGILKTDAKLWS